MQVHSIWVEVTEFFEVASPLLVVNSQLKELNTRPVERIVGIWNDDAGDAVLARQSTLDCNGKGSNETLIT